MDLEVAVEIDAAPEQAWSVLLDVERWPSWTASMQRIERLDDGPLDIGSRVRIKQPRMPAVVWEVTDLEPGRAFTWRAAGPGHETVASHRVEPAGQGSRVTLSLSQRGALMRVLAPFISGMTRRYVAMEARGLKRESEARVG